MVSTAVAILVNWIGNRYWTFRHQRRAVATREGVEFVIVSLGGLVIALGCLWVSHYVLGFTSAVADTISGNVVGLVLGTAFRFWLYTVWVYHPERDGRVTTGSTPSARQSDAATPGVATVGTGTASSPTVDAG